MKKNKFFLYYAEGKDNHGVVEDHHAEVERLSYKDILKRSWTYLLSGYLVYCITLCIFPALTSSGKLEVTIRSHKNSIKKSYLVPPPLNQGPCVFANILHGWTIIIISHG